MYIVRKGIGRVYIVSKKSTDCLKVCGTDCPSSVRSDHMVAERGIKSRSATICSVK